MMLEREAKQRDHEQKMMKWQQEVAVNRAEDDRQWRKEKAEHDEAKAKRDEKLKVARSMSPWKNNDKHVAYLKRDHEGRRSST